MKLGVVAYSSRTGLGYQSRDFCRNMNPDKILVIDLSSHNQIEVNHNWTNDHDAQIHVCQGYPQNVDYQWLTSDIDCVFVFESPLNYYLYQIAAERGVKVVAQYNYEFLDYFLHGDWLRPDLLAAPTRWGIDRVKNLGVAPVELLPVPIDRKELPFREIKQCKTFIHILGRPAAQDRNGTIAFLQAAKLLGNQYNYKIFYQRPFDERASELFYPVAQMMDQMRDEVEIIHDVAHRQDLYKQGDVLVMPRKYGGLCLPVNEALSSGMPVIMTNISPNDDLLDRSWLVNATHVGHYPDRYWVPMFEANIGSLTERMRYFGENDDNVIQANKRADEIAQMYAWENMISEYNQVMEQLCQK